MIPDFCIQCRDQAGSSVRGSIRINANSITWTGSTVNPLRILMQTVNRAGLIRNALVADRATRVITVCALAEKAHFDRAINIHDDARVAGAGTNDAQRDQNQRGEQPDNRDNDE